MADRLRRQPQPNVRQVSLTDLDNQATQSGRQPVAAPAAAEPTTSKRKKANEAVKEKQSGNDEEDEEEAIHQDHLDEAAEPRQETAAKEGELETPAGPAKKKGRTANVKPPFQNASQEPLGDITSVKGCPVVLTDELRFVQSPDTELLKIRVGNVLRAYFPKAAGRNTNLILAAIPSRRRHLRQFPRPTRDGRTGARAW